MTLSSATRSFDSKTPMAAPGATLLLRRVGIGCALFSCISVAIFTLCGGAESEEKRSGNSPENAASPRPDRAQEKKATGDFIRCSWQTQDATREEDDGDGGSLEFVPIEASNTWDSPGQNVTENLQGIAVYVTKKKRSQTKEIVDHMQKQRSEKKK